MKVKAGTLWRAIVVVGGAVIFPSPGYANCNYDGYGVAYPDKYEQRPDGSIYSPDCPYLGGGNGGGHTRAPIRYRGPSREEIAHRKATTLYNKGLAETKAGDLQSALADLKRARSLWPSLFNVDSKIHNLRLDIAQDREDARVTNELNRHGFHYAKPAATGLDAGGLGFRDEAGPGPMGTRVSNPGPADLHPAGSVTRVAVGSATDQLTSIEKSSRKAVHAPDNETAKTLSNCGFGNLPCAQPTHIAFPKTIVRTEAGRELMTHIPNDPGLMKDPGFSNAVAAYDKFERRKTHDKYRIAEIQKKLAMGRGDPKVLKASLQTVRNDVKRTTDDQAKMVKEIRKKLVNRGLAWIQTPSSNMGGAKAAHR